MGVWEVRPVPECVEMTGKKPVKVRWVDVTKGDDESSNVRCRIVAENFNIDKWPDLFAATPLLEYLRYLVSRRASSQLGTQKTKLTVQDVKKACFYAPATRDVCPHREHSLECALSFTSHCMGRVMLPSIGRKRTRKSSRAWDL